MLKILGGNEFVSKRADSFKDRIDNADLVVSDLDVLERKRVEVLESPDELVRAANDAGREADARI